MINALIFLLVFTQGAPTQEYIAKPGDMVTVTVWERPSLSGTVAVDMNGNITFPMPIGSVFVAGSTSAQISTMLTDRLKEYLVNPTVFVSISPAEGFTVHVLGEVRSPDFIKVPEGTTVQEVITRAGGFTPLADKKRIQLIRKKEDSEKLVESILNFEKFMENGDRSSNPTLKSGDVLIVPRLPKPERIRYVNVIGAVTRPGTIELEEPAPLIEVLTQAGGLSSNAVPKDISIISISDGKPLWRNVDFESFLNGNDPSANPIISPGDTVFVPTEPREPRPPVSFYVNVVGQVVRPGSYPVTSESRLFDAIYQAGGFAEQSAIDKVTIVHREPQSSVREQVNIKEYLRTGDQRYNPILEKGDTILVPLSEDAKKIPSVHEAFFPTMRISIIGEVNKPDIYQVSTGVNVLDMLKIAGGHTSQADLKRVTIIHESPKAGERQQTVDMRKVMTEGKLKMLPPLSSGDTIFVPRKPERSTWGTIVRTTSEVSTIFYAASIMYLAYIRFISY